jgi:pyruvate carboxylase
VSDAYTAVNDMFGDIIKVTPTSKVVGDMAIMMVSNGLTRAQVEGPTPVSFPESVVQLFRGDLGQPAGGFPQALQKKILGDDLPLTTRPGATLPEANLLTLRQDLERLLGRGATDTQFASYLMYPKVFLEYAADRRSFGDAAILPTAVFFYWIEPRQEVHVDIEKGKTLVVQLVAVSEPHEDGRRNVFFELNGQPRPIPVLDKGVAVVKTTLRKIADGNSQHVGAPMPGTVTLVPVQQGQSVKRGTVLVTMEAMKMETSVRADQDGTIAEVIAKPGMQVDARDLLLVLAD